MIKDLSAKLVAAAAAINQKSREAYVAEQRQIEEAKNLKAKHASMMPAQPAPKADPAAVPTAKKMAEAVEGSVPETPKEKELAAKSGDKKRITFGDVLKARGVQREGWNPIKHIPKEKQTDAIKTAAKDVKRGSYADRAALLRAGGVKEEVEQADEGLMAAMKKIGNKVLDAVAPSDEKLIDNLHKSVHGKNAPNVPKPKLKLAHDYVKEDKEKGEKSDNEKAEKKPWPSTTGPSSLFDKEKSAFTSKKVSTGTQYSRKAVKEDIECLEVQHEQFGAGKTLGQFSDDLSEVDVMFAEGIKRVSIDEIEMVEETTAIHPSAIHVSPSSGGKYKVHAVGKKFASGIKVGEHLTDTHLDDFSEMGGKIKMVKAPKAPKKA